LAGRESRRREDPGSRCHRRRTDIVALSELLADRIITFAELVGRENVIADTHCGLDDRVHPQIAWAKLPRLRDGAPIARKNLWS
jgi:5-methyltetrahydropteroyltriglutamate--homocysteine methyltransferase